MTADPAQIRLQRRGMLAKAADLIDRVMGTLDTGSAACAACGCAQRSNRAEARAHEKLAGVRKKLLALRDSEICQETPERPSL